MQKSNSKIIMISGVAGSGKSSVWHVLKNYPEKFGISISYTTREPRDGEVNGVDYHFVTKQEFDEAIKNNEFLEWEQVHFDKYGTRKKDFDDIIASGKIAVLELDVKGMEHIMTKYDNIISIFITTPTMEDAMERLKLRGTEDAKSLQKRISRYKMEMSCAKNYDHIIVNDNLKRAQNELLDLLDKSGSILQSELADFYAYGANQAKKVGITPENLNDKIAEVRKKKKK